MNQPFNTPRKDAPFFLPHDGRECPVRPETEVIVKIDRVGIAGPFFASDLDWDNSDDSEVLYPVVAWAPAPVVSRVDVLTTSA